MTRRVRRLAVKDADTGKGGDEGSGKPSGLSSQGRRESSSPVAPASPSHGSAGAEQLEALRRADRARQARIDAILARVNTTKPRGDR